MWDPALSDWIYSSHTSETNKDEVGCKPSERMWQQPLCQEVGHKTDIKGLQSGQMDNSYYSANVHFVLEIEDCQYNVCCYYYTEKKIWTLSDFRDWEARKSHKYLQVFPNSHSSVPKDSRLTKLNDDSQHLNLLNSTCQINGSLQSNVVPMNFFTGLGCCLLSIYSVT